MAVAFNPSDPTQQAFLAAVASGESGGAADPAAVGYGGVSLASAPVDAYGFPQWAGAATPAGPTHAAGIYQFQPATWDAVAAAHGLNFTSPTDQAAGAWYQAQADYAARTGGGNLYGDLQAGNYQSVAANLRPTWSSLTAAELAGANPGGALNANGAAALAGQVPGAGATGRVAIGAPTTGLDPEAAALQANANAGAAALAGSQSVPLAIGNFAKAAGTYISTAEQNIQKATLGAVSGALASAENWVGRGFLILIGAVIIGVALWALLAKADVVPSPSDAAKAVAA